MRKDTRVCEHCQGDNRISNRYCSSCGYELPKMQEEPQVIMQAPQAKPKVNWKALSILAVVIVLASVTANFLPKLLSSNAVVDKVMSEAASQLNKTCPMFIDEVTRLDNVIALPNKIFLYNYTLVGVDPKQVDTTEVKKILEPSLVNTVKSTPEMKLIRDNKVTLKYIYRDEQANYICSIVLPYEKYKE